MPLPRRSYGRPGTAVVPENWEADHAIVAAKTRTGRCAIHAPSSGKPVFDPALGYSVAPDAAELYVGTARLQSLSAADRRTLIGEQQQGTSSYLVAIDYDAQEIPAGSTITFTESNDTWANASVLHVQAADLGTLRFERDLYAVLDTTATPKGD